MCAYVAFGVQLHHRVTARSPHPFPLGLGVNLIIVAISMAPCDESSRTQWPPFKFQRISTPRVVSLRVAGTDNEIPIAELHFSSRLLVFQTRSEERN